MEKLRNVIIFMYYLPCPALFEQVSRVRSVSFDPKQNQSRFGWVQLKRLYLLAILNESKVWYVCLGNGERSSRLSLVWPNLCLFHYALESPED